MSGGIHAGGCGGEQSTKDEGHLGGDEGVDSDVLYQKSGFKKGGERGKPVRRSARYFFSQDGRVMCGEQLYGTSRRVYGDSSTREV